MDSLVKHEPFEEEAKATNHRSEDSKPVHYIDLSSTDNESDDEAYDDLGKALSFKKQKLDDSGVILPVGFLDPLPPDDFLPLPEPVSHSRPPAVIQSCKQFWKAGDYEGDSVGDSTPLSVGMDHVRVHPKFLHSNATSHKWALGAFAELLDNSLDEVCNGATYVNIDMLENKKDGSRMLLIEDNGGGMDPDKMRQCMSLGYSVKSKLANTIGQYGNGFKTSTMRLGADVIVFSRCRGRDGKCPTQSVGMLSYTFLRSTGKEDIIVPMVDYDKGGHAWNKMMRSSVVDWNRNFETILEWSPYSSEADLLAELNLMKDQGTRIIIYNLWEDDEGELELDFGADRHDIQVRGVNRDDRKIQMAKQFPNSRHFLTYRHSLRSYASILYLRLPPGFKMILRGRVVEHHNTVNDMMLIQEITYRPQPGADGVPKDPNMVAIVTIGFVKDAKDHIDVQGFNVYHKNRLIKPFWRVWNPAGSDGRGVIGVLEANFVEPAHDKQGFERTTVLSRLEGRLVQMQKTYWTTQCHKVGYAPRGRNRTLLNYTKKETSPKVLSQPSSRHLSKGASPSSETPLVSKSQGSSKPGDLNRMHGHGGNGMKASATFRKKISASPRSRLRERSPSTDDESDHEIQYVRRERPVNECGIHKASPAQKSCQKDSSRTSQSSPLFSDNSEMEQHHDSKGGKDRIVTRAQSKATDVTCNGNGPGLQDSEADIVKKLEEENCELKDRLNQKEESMLLDLQFERDKNKSLEAQIHEAERKLEEMSKEQDALINVFAEERDRRDKEEENLRKKLKDASNTIQELLERVRSR